jgi:hypothetical protein
MRIYQRKKSKNWPKKRAKKGASLHLVGGWQPGIDRTACARAAFSANARAFHILFFTGAGTEYR